MSEGLRCDPLDLVGMTYVDKSGQSADVICRGRVPQICRSCAGRYIRENASGTVTKHWRMAWRISCLVCQIPLADTNEHPNSREILRDTSPFGHLWPEVLAGEEIVERFLSGDNSL